MYFMYVYFRGSKNSYMAALVCGCSFYNYVSNLYSIDPSSFVCLYFVDLVCGCRLVLFVVFASVSALSVALILSICLSYSYFHNGFCDSSSSSSHLLSSVTLACILI